MNRRHFIETSVGAVASVSLAGYLGRVGETASLQETVTVEEPIVIGSDIPYRPFEYRTEDGTLVGFDVDIAEAIFAEQLGLEYEFQQTGFDTIIPSLNNGNFRIIMSAMTITEDRAEKVDFSDPYFTAYQTVAILENSDVESLEDLRGTTVAVQKGTTGEGAAEQLREEFDGELTIDSYDQITGAFNALLNNQAVAVINDNTVNAAFVEDNENVVFLEGEGEAAEQGDEDAPPYLTLTVEEYGIAFRQDDDAFRERVNEALATIREDGTYDEIYEEWFGTGGEETTEGTPSEETGTEGTATEETTAEGTPTDTTTTA